MLKFLDRLNSVLTADEALTAIVPADNIGASVRQNAETPSLEYGIGSLTKRDPKGHCELVLLFFVHSRLGAGECWRAAEALHSLMIVTRLNDPQEVCPSFRVMRCHLQDTRSSPRNDWASSLRIEYRIHLAELLSEPTQKQ